MSLFLFQGLAIWLLRCIVNLSQGNLVPYILRSLFIVHGLTLSSPISSQNQRLDGSSYSCDLLLPGETLLETEMGPVKGLHKEFVDHRIMNQLVSWTEYLSIPYAVPPIGELRFLDPLPLRQGWECPPEVVLPQPMCSQYAGLSLDPRSSEDCLMLNVYVPEKLSTELLPVMVYIHGGSFTSGDGSSASFGPKYFMSQGVIVVGINYRLGPLGFLSLGTEKVSGNQGMKDQVLALQWVQDNIQSFGGDPSKVTIFGQSAGSMSVTYHLVSPLSKGLFNRVIAQSGLGGFSPSFHHFQTSTAAKYGAHSATLMGCEEEGQLLECLQNKTSADVMALNTLMEGMTQPCIDKDVSPIPFLEANPLDLIAEGNYNTEVDIIVGANADEGIMLTEYMIAAPDLLKVIGLEWDILGPLGLFQLHHTESSPEDAALAHQILDYYTDGGGAGFLGPHNLKNMTDMLTDSFIWFGMDLFLDNHLPHAQGNTFQYLLSYWGEYHRVHVPGFAMSSCPGVTHSDELYFLFSTYYGEEYPLNEEDGQLSLKLTSMWTNFAKYGHPTPTVEALWQPSEVDQRKYLRIDRETEMNLDPDYVRRMAFWKTLDINRVLQ